MSALPLLFVRCKKQEKTQEAFNKKFEDYNIKYACTKDPKQQKEIEKIFDGEIQAGLTPINLE